MTHKLFTLIVQIEKGVILDRNIATGYIFMERNLIILLKPVRNDSSKYVLNVNLYLFDVVTV